MTSRSAQPFLLLLLLLHFPFGLLQQSSPLVNRIIPASGPLQWSGPVQVVGEALSNASSYLISWSETNVLFCTWVSQTELSCPQAGIITPGFISVEIKADSRTITPENFTFLYYNPPTLYALDPSSGDLAGGYNVTIWGWDFFPNPTDGILCKFGDYVVPARFNDGLNGSLTCLQVPPSAYEGFVKVLVSQNGRVFGNSSLEFHYTSDSSNSSLGFDIAIIICGAVFLLSIPAAGFFFWLYKEKKRKQALAPALHKIEEGRGLNAALNYYDLELISPPIGKGSDGVVNKAKYHGRFVAVKTYMSPSAANRSMDDFTRELRNLSKLRHPNIIHLVGACTHPSLCIVMEYVERGSLLDVIMGTPKELTRKRIMRIATEIAQGMAYLHDFIPPLLHRDLKSANILITHNWHAKISDFGISRQLCPTTMTHRVGTTRWTAPEVLNYGDPHYSTKADVYSFGIVLYELLTKRTPFYDMNWEYKVEMAIMEGARPTVPKRTRRKRPEMTALMEQCWQHDPDRRPTFAQILEFFSGMTQGQNISNLLASSPGGAVDDGGDTDQVQDKGEGEGEEEERPLLEHCVINQTL